MTILDVCLIISIPLYVVLSSRLEGRAKDVALWAYLWMVASFQAINTWHFYTTYRRLAPLVDAVHTAEMTQTLWLNIVMSTVFYASPVMLLYVRRRRKGRMQVLEPAVPEEDIWPPAPTPPA